MCPAGPSCCSHSVEARLADWSIKKFREDLVANTEQMAGELEQRATQIDGKKYLDILNIF